MALYVTLMNLHIRKLLTERSQNRATRERHDFEYESPCGAASDQDGFP
jgi:cell division protein FtsL